MGHMRIGQLNTQGPARAILMDTLAPFSGRVPVVERAKRLPVMSSACTLERHLWLLQCFDMLHQQVTADAPPSYDNMPKRDGVSWDAFVHKAMFRTVAYAKHVLPKTDSEKPVRVQPDLLPPLDVAFIWCTYIDC